MARRGRFGRSGTSQNLTMLVYQILKEQMQDELQAILDAYETNMAAGMYEAQFNGQNVDGEYVIEYMKQMLAGFPPGSTEYETLNSRLETFQQRYRTDVQNLVMKSLNEGSSIDFGLLGSKFQNRGISEVTLSDMRGWAEQEIADLEASGATTQADKLKGAVFVAGFNVESDGKRAAVTRGDLSYAAYAKWLGGQLKEALDSGLTKSSKAYLDLLNLHADALKAAKADGEQKAAEGYDNAIRDALAPANAAAKAILDAYTGPYKDNIMSLMSQVSSASRSRYYDLLQVLAVNPGTSAYYEDVMRTVGQGNLDELFAEEVVATQDKLNKILNNGFGGATPKDAETFGRELDILTGNGMLFLSASGVEFNSGMAKTAMAEMYKSLKSAGMSFNRDEQTGSMIGRGGHPDAVLAALSNISKVSGDVSGTYTWLADAAKGQVDVAFLANTPFVDADTSGDGKVDGNEWRAAFDSGNYTNTEIDAAYAQIAQNAQGEFIPNSDIQPASLIFSIPESHFAASNLAAGSIMIADQTGAVRVTERGTTQVGEEELRPQIITVNGKQSIVYVKPITVKQYNGGTEYTPLDPSMTNGMKITVYRVPGNITNIPGQQFDVTVTIEGMTKDSNGNNVNQAVNLTGDEFKAVMRSQFGAEFDFTSLQGEQADTFLSFTGTLQGKPDFWQNFLSKQSEYYIGNIPLRAGEPNGPKAVPGWNDARTIQTGTLNNLSEFNQWLTRGLQDPSILAKAQELAARRGKEVDTSDVLDVILTSNGIARNISYNTIKGLTESNPIWQNALSTQFASVKPPVTSTPSAPQGSGNYGAGSSTPTSSYPGYRPPIQQPTSPYPVMPPTGQSAKPSSQSGVGAIKPISPVLKQPEAAIPKITPTSISSAVSPFLKDSFRNRPEMVKPTTLSTGALAYKPITTPTKTTTPTIGNTTPLSQYVRGVS